MVAATRSQVNSRRSSVSASAGSSQEVLVAIAKLQKAMDAEFKSLHDRLAKLESTNKDLEEQLQASLGDLTERIVGVARAIESNPPLDTALQISQLRLIKKMKRSEASTLATTDTDRYIVYRDQVVRKSRRNRQN